MAQPHELAAGSNPLLPNATFIAEVVAFLIILGVIWRFALPRMQGMLRARQEMVRQQVEDATASGLGHHVEGRRHRRQYTHLVI